MARASGTSIDQIMREAVEAVVARASASISRAIGSALEAEVGRHLGNGVQPRQRRPGRQRRGARSRARAEITTWVPDRRARRVPTFVIEATGLDTKKKIVAKFGDTVTFRKGGPLPSPKEEAVASQASDAANRAAREVTAKPPVLRKAAAK